MPVDPSTGAEAITTPPMSPNEAPITDPAMMGGQPQVGPVDEAEMKFDLERMLGKVKTKNADFEEKQVLSSEKLEGLKSKIVKEIFGLMKDLGVDPSDLNSINEFLQKLQQQDPDLYVMFESAINSLAPEAPEAPGMQGMPGMGAASEMGVAPGMGAVPGMLGEGEKQAIPGSEEGRGLMESNSTNLQEKILRQ